MADRPKGPTWQNRNSCRARGVILINTDRLPGAEQLLRQGPDVGNGLLDAYFQSVADDWQEQTFTNTTRRMSLVEATGIAAVDFSSLVKWSLGVHLFTWADSRTSGAGSWAIFKSPELILNTPPSAVWQEAQQWLLGEFGVDTLTGSDRPIDIAAQTFAGLIQDARAHPAENRVREAFLYFVIALDHLLGEDGRSDSTVADRTSVLTHRMRATAFEAEVARVRRIYDARSRLVHGGSPVTDNDLHEADSLARGVLWAITRVVGDGDVETSDAWVEKIDSLAHLLRGDHNVVTDERLATVGALAAFQTGPPPPMLRDRGGA